MGFNSAFKGLKQYLNRPVTSPEDSRRSRLPDFETVGT